jgi:hydrophobic/amphiphilic exporter-1 (mainly G- bacteria), HAE1 family
VADVIRAAIRRPIAVSMAYLAFALLGLAAWRRIPLELIPDVQLPRLSVHAAWAGASPETVEALLTSPLEAAIEQVRGVARVTSTSDEQRGLGTSRIVVEFTRGTRMELARLELSERLAALDGELPRGAVGPFVSPYVPAEMEGQRRAFLRYTVAGPRDTDALRRYVDDSIAPVLRQVRGVADVQVSGGRDPRLAVTIDEARAAALAIDPEAVRRAVEELELVRTPGSVAERGVLRALAVRQRAESAEDVRRAILASPAAGRLVRVADVASVTGAYESPRSAYRVDGQPAVTFTVLRTQGVNVLSLDDAVKRELARLVVSRAGVRLVLDEDESSAIRAQLTDLSARALASAAVVAGVLLLFLRAFGPVAVVLSTVAFSTLIALNLVYFAGYSLNVLTLMGLATGFGLIVDNAIIVLENVHRRWRLGEPADRAAEEGTREVGLAIATSTLTTVVVFVPFVYLQGELRLYYQPFAVTVALSQAASLVVAFTLVPSLAARLLGWRAESVGAAHARLYGAVVARTLRHPWATVVAAGLVFAGSYAAFARHVSRRPVWRAWTADDAVDVQVKLPLGETLARADRAARQFEAALRPFASSVRVVAHADPQYAHVRVVFPDSLRHRRIPFLVKERLTLLGQQIGGAEVHVYGLGRTFQGAGASPPSYTIRVLGYNYETVREIADAIGARLRRYPRVGTVDVNASGAWYEREKSREVVVRLDRRRLALFGLTARDVSRYVAAAVGADGAGTVLRLGGREVRVVVTLAGHDSVDVLRLERLLLPAGAHATVRVGDVAVVEERETLSRIVREDQQYQRLVTYEFRGPPRVGDQLHASVMEGTRVPDGYRLEGGPEWAWDEAGGRQVLGVVAVALVLVFVATAALFESVRQPLCVLLTVPMALTGVFAAFLVTGAAFTREAYIGVVMMSGIVVNSAILVVDRVNAVRRERAIALEHAIAQGALDRLRPILMTSAVTVLGLLPLVAFSDTPDANIWNAMGYTLVGGLTSSTVLVLVVTPALYLLFERRGRPPLP